jgi:hypothetical protein
LSDAQLRPYQAKDIQITMSLRRKSATIDMKRASVRTIAGETEVDHAIATLVLAFSTDPVARWMYDARINICGTSPDCSKLLARPRSNQEQRIEPATVLGWRHGFLRVFTLTMAA